MSSPLTADHSARPAQLAPAAPRRVAVARAVLALLWAVAVVVAIGDDVSRTSSDLPAAAAALLTAYPLIDVVASLLAAGAGAAERVHRINAAIGALAVVAIGVAAFTSDAGATLTAFGAWAALTGAIQLGVALRRRAEGGRLPLMLSGAISTVAGLGFVAAAGGSDADLRMLGGYMALGAVFFLLAAWRAPDAR